MMEELGSGFYLAMHDLEIRGAGEVLGESQSGEMQEVGFAMYADMLNHAVKSLKAGREPDLMQPFEVATEVNLHTPALLPDDYCSDVHERLVLYKRLANSETEEELRSMQEELVDRFGTLPEPARALVESHRLRILGKPLGMARLDVTAETIQIQFEAKPSVDPARIIQLIQKNRGWRLAGPTKLRIESHGPTLAERTGGARAALEALAGKAA
jgi:transcription-repair coupling factor (superfamily II helicase)